MAYVDRDMEEQNESQGDADDESASFRYKIADRGRGILTEEDRRYLLDQKEIEGQDERNTRYRIRERIIESIFDAGLIAENLSNEDLELIANHESVPPIGELINLAYSLLEADERAGNPPINRFESEVAGAIVDRPMESAVKQSEDGPRVEWTLPSVEIEIEQQSQSSEEAVMSALRQKYRRMDDEDLEKLLEDAVSKRQE
jgi:hypothetical protein